MFEENERVIDLEVENDALRKSLALVKEALASANDDIYELKKVIAERDAAIAKLLERCGHWLDLDDDEPNSRNQP